MTFIDFSAALSFIQSQGYFVMLLIMIIEGPIITAAAAFAASIGIFNVYLVLILSILGNIVGDSIYYFIGKIGRKAIVDKYFEKFGISLKRIKTIEKNLKNHLGKALFVIKVVPPLPTPGLILAGAANVPFRRFLFFSTIISICYSLFFTLVGFYLGVAFDTIVKYSNYIEIGVVVTLIIGVIAWWMYRIYTKRLIEEVEKKNF